MIQSIHWVRGTIPAVVLFVGVMGSARAQPAIDVTYFRSDQGHAPANSAAPSQLDATANQVWRCELSSGHSSPCVVDGRILLTTFESDSQRLATVALDRNSGEVLWRRRVPRVPIESCHAVGSPASATPASDGRRVYLFFGSFGILCYDMDGNLVWSRRLGPFRDEFGSASSPVLVGDLVIVNQDHDIDNALYAFDKRSGEPAWRVDRNEFTRSYATPVIAQVDGETQIVVPGALTLTGYLASTGERRWWLHGLARIVNPTPAVFGDWVYVPTWSPGGDAGERVAMEPWADAIQTYDADEDGTIHRTELLPGPVLTRFFRIDLDQNDRLDRGEWEKHAEVFERARNSVLAIQLGGQGDRTESNIRWSFAKGIPYVASPLVHDGVLYLVKDGGVLTALDATTGKLLHQGRLRGRGNYYASPYVVDGKIYLASERGVVTVVSAAAHWDVLDVRDFEETIYATPVARDGRLYVRTSAALYCFQ